MRIIEEPVALIVVDPDGGYNVVDTRDGEALAWRSELESAVSVASFLNATYPTGSVAPAHDSLVHEIVGFRITDEVPVPLDRLSKRDLAVMIPNAINGPLDPGLWRPRT